MGVRLELPADLADEFLTRREGGVFAAVRRDFAPVFDRLGLLAAAEVEPGDLGPEAEVFRPEGGRGDLAVVPAGPVGEAVVRPFRRGGLVRHLLHRRYFLGARALRELVLTRRLGRRGVPVADPLAAVHARRRPGYGAALVTRRVTGARPAGELLAAPAAHGPEDPRRDVLTRMGVGVGRLHAAGGVHPDLNVHNFLIPSRGSAPAVILDFDRARAFTDGAPRLLARWNLRRLRRSLRKEGLEAALEEAWDAFRAAYDHERTRVRRSREDADGSPPATVPGRSDDHRTERIRAEEHP